LSGPSARRRVRRGTVIAFVGPEATGKSTMLAATGRWLAGRRDVRSVHVGKPPSTALTVLPNLLLPALRALVPHQRSTHVDAQHVELGDADGLEQPPLLFAIRAVLLAHDRRALLRRSHAAADHGAVVLCDRYPSSVTGAPDSPQLARWADVTAGRGLRGWLVRTETRMYADVPPADVVFLLWAPLAVALQRNRDREKTEPETLVALRHRQAGMLEFDGCEVHRLDTTRAPADSRREVREVAAKILTGSAETSATAMPSPSSGVSKIRNRHRARPARFP
jgi:thymidylate kinase